ncbi:MAG TPA: AmmeMemoRadiSam system protein A [Candidatus Acidoferrales bacterium]|nr:AmmeMemoRadiSam system protein A [Candidatus Acidoferrales bacterium]
MSQLPRPLSDEDRRALLDLARRAVAFAVENRGPLDVVPGPGMLSVHAGAFVTLHRRDRLRGCMGQLEPDEALARVVAHCATSAAREDPRFEPVRVAELGEIEIEISVLSPLTPIRPEEIETGKHGLVVTRGEKRGVLLPQVAARYGWTGERFLEETCVKGGMEREAWRDPATRIEAVIADVFSEADFGSESRRRAV